MELMTTTDPPEGVPGLPARRLLTFLLTGYLIAFASVTMLNVALPAAQADLGMSATSRQWVVTAYSLAFGSLLLLGGRLADVLGLRRAMVLGLWGFAAASLIAGTAPNAAVLIVGRAGQGAAAALTAPAALALLSVSFPTGPARARAFATLGIVMGAGMAGSLVVAGWLVDVASWRWAILLNVAAATGAAVGVTRTAPAGEPARGSLDLAGAALVTGAFSALVLGFDRAGVDGWGSASSVALLAVGAVLAVAAAVWVARNPAALLPRRIVVDRGRARAFLAVFALAIGMFGGIFVLTAYLQDVQGWSALRTGLAFLPFSAASLVGARAVTRGAGPAGDGPLLVGGLVATGAALVLVARLDTGSTFVAGVLPIMVLLGLGGTTVMVTASDLATRAAGADSGIAGAAVGAVQQLGAAVGTALLTSIATSATATRHPLPAPRVADEAWRDALLHGFTRAGAVGAALLAVGAVVLAATGARRRGGASS